MSVVTLRDPSSGSTAQVATGFGFNCFSFRAVVGRNTIDVIEAPEDFDSGVHRASKYGIPILFPFPNRIRKGRFTWNGREYAIPPEIGMYHADGNAIHGFCVDRPWRVARSDESSVTGQFQLSVDAPDRAPYWPADALIEIRYSVRRAALRAEIRIANPDSKPLPWGFGTHPYFRVPLSGASNPGRCTIEAAVTKIWELTEALPTGRLLAVPEDKNLADAPYFDLLKLDTVYTGLTSTQGVIESTIIDEDSGLMVTQRCPDVFRELVAFTPPDRDAICLEPYTCTSDAINLHERGIDAGWRVLEPGGEFRTWIEISAAPVLV